MFYVASLKLLQITVLNRRWIFASLIQLFNAIILLNIRQINAIFPRKLKHLTCLPEDENYENILPYFNGIIKLMIKYLFVIVTLQIKFNIETN
ncbi:hypothetical protein EGR_00984 [Echinococcus granulosus]|uniref:Uncharacterized protein n=1 Tax=Echinococcus granulosus TaxID=6210 RepID=W6URZ7_ECHGR|nr:hypothetical protein EGR_00984 [Echinococcus granulosus]EUB64440.1 hypothetical protein EGR_00984 [Echinococcus granulosus]